MLHLVNHSVIKLFRFGQARCFFIIYTGTKIANGVFVCTDTKPIWSVLPFTSKVVKLYITLIVWYNLRKLKDTKGFIISCCI